MQESCAVRERLTKTADQCCSSQFAVSSNTTLLVSSGAEGLDLLGVQQPKDKILEQPEQHLAMHASQPSGPVCTRL
ncbi:hypothetical protein [Dictyobacter formicarum]|uniref:Uncharacterized protein n=1 Tax=Dictyobacter formicarum TaxID=2778368 RepID=A0ABQ3VP92_9CHLR|nr:hypothetical protein [Dictyobacter formicarum]GHO88064.1 hypothetical protein KSZ_60700 [Dictyobacter formicarum]